MGIKTYLTGAVAACAIAGSASAAVIDFTTATNDGMTAVAVGATVVAGAGSTLNIGDFDPNTICALGGFGCNGLMTFTFDDVLSAVSFDYGYGDPGDIATLSIFDAMMTLVSTVILNSEAGVEPYTLSGLGDFKSIIFDTTASTGAGYAFGNFDYTAAATIPLPATLPLLLAGVAGFAAIRRKRQG